MSVIFEFISAWQVLGKENILTLNFEKFKERYYPMLAFCIEDMNWKFGAGEISEIVFHTDECEPANQKLYGRIVRVDRNKKDERFFKLENGYVIFLSHKRKLKNGPI